MRNAKHLGAVIKVDGLSLEEYGTETAELEGLCPKMSCYVQSRNGKQFEIECLRSEDDVTENLMFKVHLDGFYQDNVIMSTWIASEIIQGQQTGNKLHRFQFNKISLTDDEAVYSQYENESVIAALGTIKVEVFKYTMRNFDFHAQGFGHSAPLPSTSSMQFNEQSAKAQLAHTAGVSQEGEDSTCYQSDGYPTGAAIAIFIFKYREHDYLVDRELKPADAEPTDEGVASPPRNSPGPASSTPSPANLPDLPPNNLEETDDLPPPLPDLPAPTDLPAIVKPDPDARPSSATISPAIRRRRLAHAGPARTTPNRPSSSFSSRSEPEERKPVIKTEEQKPVIKPDPEAANSNTPQASGSGSQDSQDIASQLAAAERRVEELRALQAQSQAGTWRIAKREVDEKPNIRPNKKHKVDQTGAVDLTQDSDQDEEETEVVKKDRNGKGKSKE